MADFDYVVTVGADAGGIMEEILSNYSTAKQKLNDDEILINFKSDDKSLANIIKQINSLDLDKKIVLKIDEGNLQKQLKKIDGYTGKTASNISKSIQKELSGSFSGLNIKQLIEDELGGGTKTSGSVSTLIKKLSGELSPTIDSDSTYESIIKQAEAYEKLKVVVNEVKSSNIRGIKINENIIKDRSGFEFDVKSFTDQYNQFYKEIGNFISKNTPNLISNVESQIQESRKSLLRVLSGSGANENILFGLEDDIKNIENQISEAEKTLQNAKNNLSKNNLQSLMNSIVKDLDTKDLSESEYDQKLSELLQIYNKYKEIGGSIRSLNNNVQGSIEDAIDYGIKPSQNDLFGIQEQENLLDNLKQKLSELKTLQNTYSSPVESMIGLNSKNQSLSQVESLNAQLSETKSKLDEVNQKFADQKQIISNLESQLSGMKEKSDSYDSISSQLKEAQSELDAYASASQRYFEELNAAETKIRMLDGKDVSADELAHQIEVTQDLCIQLNKINDLYNQQKIKISELESQVSSLNAENEKLTNKSKEDSLSSNKYKTELESTSAKLQEAKQLLASQTAESDQLRASLESVSNILSECVSKLKQFKFDPLEQANKQLLQFQNSGDSRHYDKAASYYGLYTSAGGKEKISLDGQDVTNDLISRYQELGKAYSLNRQQLVQMLNAKNMEILASRENVQSLEAELAALNKKKVAEDKSQKRNSDVNKRNETLLKNALSKKRAASSNSSSNEPSSTPLHTDKEAQTLNLQKEIVTQSVGSEVESLNMLDSKISDVTAKVNEKTSAFEREKEVVSAAMNDEASDMSALEEFINTLINTVDTLSDNIKDISKIEFSLNDKEMLGIKSVIESLDLIKTIDIKPDMLSGLKLSKSNIENIRSLCTVLNDLKATLDSFSTNSKETLSSIRSIVEQASAIKDLSNIIKNPKQAKNNIQANDTSKRSTYIDDIEVAWNDALIENVQRVSASYDKLIPKVKEYYTLLNKSNNGSLTLNEQIKFNALKSDIDDAIRGLGKYYIELEDVTSGQERFNNEINKVKETIRDNYIDGINNELKTLSDSKHVDLFKSKIEEIRVELEKIKSEPIDEFFKPGKIQKNISDQITAIKKSKEYKLADPLQIGNLNSRISVWMNNNSAAAGRFGSELDSLKQRLKEVGLTSSDLESIEAEFRRITAAANDAGKTGASFGEKLGNKFKELGAYLLSFASFYDIINIGKQAVSIVTELDDALTEMRKVSEEPLAVLKNYQRNTFDIANDIGTTSAQLQQSTADWMRLGESLSKAQQSAQDATILKNVSEFDSIEAATESLVAMSQAYNDLDKIEIVDILNNIGNNFSISTDGLATGLQKSAAALKVAGNDINEATALITAGNAIVQDPDSVGAGVRTIALRIQGTEEAKQELSDLGEDVEDYVVQTSSKINQQVINYTKAAGNQFKGVSLLDNNGNYRSTYEILQDISDVYDEIVATDKAAGTNRMQGLLELLAGKNRSNIAASILQNGELLRSVYESAQNSEGSAQQELDKYLDSITGKTAQLQNQLQELASVAIDSEGLKSVIDLLTQAVALVTSLVENFGALNLVIGAAGGILATKSGFGKNFVVLNAPFYKAA